MTTSQIERENINAWDWTHAERYCRRYLERNLYEMGKTYLDDARAYTTAIVVSYSRPFSGNRDRSGERDAIDKKYVEALTKQNRTVHDRIVDLRNKVFAHSDASFHNVQIRDTECGGMTTFSHDPLIPLEKSDVECLLTNIKQFNEINETLRKDAAAAYLSAY